MNLPSLFAGLTLVCIAAFITWKEFQKVKANADKYGKTAFAVLLMELLSISPLYLAVVLLLIGAVFVLNGINAP